MAELKTKPTAVSVESFVESLGDAGRQADCRRLIELMQAATGSQPKMWGASMVGFGDRHYRYASGHEGDTFVLGFAPRKEALTLYLSGGVEPLKRLLARLGKHKVGKGCLYIRRLADVDTAVLAEVLAAAVANLPVAGPTSRRTDG